MTEIEQGEGGGGMKDRGYRFWFIPISPNEDDGEGGLSSSDSLTPPNELKNPFLVNFLLIPPELAPTKSWQTALDGLQNLQMDFKIFYNSV